MKNIVKILGIIAIVTSGIVLSSCKEEEKPNPFVGTWEGGIYNYRLVFTETNISISHLSNGNTFINSPYTYDDNHLYYKNTSGRDIYYVYRFQDGKLVLMEDTLTHYYTKVN